MVRLSPPAVPRQAVDVRILRELTARQPEQAEPAAEFMQRVRDDSRY